MKFVTFMVIYSQFAANQRFAAAGTCPNGIEHMGRYTFLGKFVADFAIEMKRLMGAMIRD